MAATLPDIDTMRTALAIDGGFTFDPIDGQFLRPREGIAGWCVAVPGTERESLDSLAALIAERTDVTRPFIGGWWDEQNGRYIVEITELLDITRDAAIALGRDRDQQAVMSMLTGEVVFIASE